MLDAPPTAITERLADYVVSARHADLPATVRHEALRAFLNILGSTIGGSRHVIVDLADRALGEFAGPPRATLIGRGHRADALHACLINCLASSVYSFDDTHAQAILHPSGPAAAAALAVAERMPVTGADFLTAFALGVEIECRLSKAISVLPARGTIAWSQTGIAGGVGAVVAAGKLLGLDRIRLQHAIGIAASQAAGFRVMHGTMCTPMMPAQAAQTGLRAAFLAARGFTSSLTSLEGRYGYLEVFCEQPNVPALIDGLGAHFEILANTYKPYPCGIVIHPIIDACLKLRQERGLDHHQIARIGITAAPSTLALCDRRNPQNEMQAHVSLYHWTAIALLRGGAKVQDMEDQVVRDPDIVAFQDRIYPAKADAKMTPDMAEVTLHLHDGTRRVCLVENCSGSAGNPMTDAQLERKFLGLAEPPLGTVRSRRLISRCWSLESADEAGAIARDAA